MIPGDAGLTAQLEHVQDATGAKATTTKKPKSRLHGYVKILTAPGGIDVQVLFDSIRKDLSFILRVQMKTHKRLFLRWSPKLNLDATSIDCFKLEQPEAMLVMNSREQVFRMVTQALHNETLPPGHLCLALNGSIVQCTRVDAGTDSGAAAGDILWHVICAKCLQGLRSYVQNKKLEKVDIKLKRDLMYVRSLQIKQAGKFDFFVYQPQPTRHDVWPCKPGVCAACNAMSGVVSSYELTTSSAHKGHGEGGKTSSARALGAPPQSFQRTYSEHCCNSFDSESETTQVPGAKDAGWEITDMGGSEDEADDMDCECEHLLTSEDDCDQESEQGQVHALTMEGGDFDGHWSVDDFFRMDNDMHDNVQDFLLNMRAASPLSLTEATGAELCASASACADTGTHTEPQEGAGERAMQRVTSAVLPGGPVLPAAGRKKSAIDYVLNPGFVPSSASAAAAFALHMLRQSTRARTREPPAQ